MYEKFIFLEDDIANEGLYKTLSNHEDIDRIVHLAAQAGVRYSIDNPESYFKSNLEGFFNILEISKKNKVNHLLFASTSSVYGNNSKFPLNEKTNTDKPLSFYAATKKSNEVMAYSYSNIYKLPTTALRFFTVYGPFGRPDMSLFKFTKATLENKEIQLFNSGNHIRDFTYVDDIAKGTIAAQKEVGYEIINLGGGNNPVSINQVIGQIESGLSKRALIDQKPFHKADMKTTWADISKAKRLLGWEPQVPLAEGIQKTVEWHQANRDWLGDIRL